MPLWNFYYFSNSLSSLMSSVSSDKQVMVLYLVPAILYCVSNNVFFLSISYFNPTTYAMFLQIRLLLTGLIYQVRQKTWQNPSVSWLFTLLIIYRKSLRIYKNYTHYPFLMTFQILFKNPLTGKQWISLLVLTMGCMVHAAGQDRYYACII